MAKRFYIWILFVFLAGPYLSGCSEKKAVVQPPVSVEVVKVTAAEMTQSIDVVGSLSPKFQADVKSRVLRRHYSGIRNRMGAGTERDAACSA